jgi:hypothetical protein
LYPEIDVDVLAFHDKSTVCWMVAPEPLAVSEANVELLVKKEMLAEAIPVAVGANVTLKGRLWPAASVTGKVNSPRVNAELLELLEDTVTLPPPAVKLPDWVCVVPIVTLPKLMVPGVMPNVPLEVVPLPVKDTPTDGSDALELRESVALAVPVVDGVKVTERLVLPPAAKVYGKVRPLTLKAVSLTVALEMVRLDPPELDKLSSFVWLLPTVTVPRFMLEGTVK